MKADILKKDWVLALVIAVVFGIAALSRTAFLEGLERAAYDFGVKMTSRNANATDKVAIIAIDDASIEKIGRWPWPRSVLASMIQRLGQAQPKLIGLQIFLGESQTDPGLVYLRKVSDLLSVSRIPKVAPREAAQIEALLKQGEQELNTDQKLAQALPAGNVFMPMFFRVGIPLGKPDAPLPDFVQRNRLIKIIAPQDGADPPPSTFSVNYPLAQFGKSTAGIGHLNLLHDIDGGVRTEPLVLEHYGEYYPSLALLMAARSLNLGPGDISVNLGEGIKLGNLVISTDSSMQMYTGFYPKQGDKLAFPTYSFYDVYAGTISPQVFKNKIILIGPTAVGIGTTQMTPVSSTMDGPELTANIVTSILDQDFYTRPFWTKLSEFSLFLAIVAYLIFLPRLSAGSAALVSLALFAVLLGLGHYLLVSQKVWLQSVTPAMLLLTGHLGLTTKRFFITERAKVRVESDSAQTNRMLGLAFQGQGQLDMAMDKFRTLPVDDSVLELIHNLALDFERKRQFNKAEAAYDYILKHNPKFKDIAERKKRAHQADSTMIIGGGRASSPGGTLIMEGTDQKPTLGRYEIERELGKGAMGAVYLGRDPKINRVVAIKTMALSDEFSGHELEEVKARFFREAETAGRLHHPNIVTIYDAGEEHDLAYIAMEFLQGKDLTAYVEADKLLPRDEVLRIIATIASALDYAHKQDVVHRDIKPANIMYGEQNGSVKITDFGIARITAASRTKTGVILGTPSYMSPEQLAGKHVDGRSDLFSLGVMTYEMLTGKQPFTGDSMATLMFQIANEKHPDILEISSELPACIREVIDRALAKDPTKRFQNGEEFKQAIEKCLGNKK